MRYVLADRNKRQLSRFARGRVLFGFDYDGTLASIVRDPAKAKMRECTRRLLARLASKRPCVIVSGRARGDVAERLRGTGVSLVIGNHGIEPSAVSGRAARAVRGWRRSLEGRLAGLPGVMVEDKTYSVAVHYRRARRKLAAARAIRAAARALGRVRLVAGKQVLNVLPRAMPNKGTAFEAVRARLGCSRAVYVGDDETDEDVFARPAPRGRLLAIRVGPSAASSARYFIRSQSEIDELLRQLIGTAGRPRMLGTQSKHVKRRAARGFR